MKDNDKRIRRLWVGLLLPLVCVLLIFCPLGCAKREGPSPYNTASQELYLRSQRELANGEYQQAYRSYQKAVAMDPRVADVNHLSSILYAWAISRSEAVDVPLLDAQKRVWLEPQQMALRRALLSVAVDRGKGVIYAFGLGMAPENTSNPAQRRLLARKAALADSRAWIARLARWAETGVECPFEVTQTVAGVEELKEYWVGETIYVVNVRAPIDCLG